IRKKNSLKDCVAVAGPLGVTHFLILSKTETSVYFVNLNTIKRCLLINYNPDSQELDFRHYSIRVVPVGASRGMKKLLQEKFPNMSRLQDVSELLATAVRLTEIGPRMTLQLIKIQEGVGEGNVLFHSFVHKTEEELQAILAAKEEKLRLKAQRQDQQAQNVQRKRERREAHNEAEDPGAPPEAEGVSQQEEEEDEAEYFRQAVGEEPDEANFSSAADHILSGFQDFLWPMLVAVFLVALAGNSLALYRFCTQEHRPWHPAVIFSAQLAHAWAISAAGWALAALLAAPVLSFSHLSGPQQKGKCTVDRPDACIKCLGTADDNQLEAYRVYSLALVALGCGLPLLLSLVTYGALGQAMQQSHGMTAANKLRVMVLVASGIALYASSYVPYYVTGVLNVYARQRWRALCPGFASVDQAKAALGWRTYVAHQVTRGLVPLAICVHPLLYMAVVPSLYCCRRRCPGCGQGQAPENAEYSGQALPLNVTSHPQNLGAPVP
ncbi:hypothetical protein E2I00_009479, partial [Balaenoptera physalus]